MDNLPFQNLKEFEAFMKAGENARPEIYKKLTDLLDSGNFAFKDMITVLDWLNAQVILNFIKDEWQAKRSVDLLNTSTKKVITAMFKEGLVSKEVIG